MTRRVRLRELRAPCLHDAGSRRRPPLPALVSALLLVTVGCSKGPQTPALADSAPAGSASRGPLGSTKGNATNAPDRVTLSAAAYATAGITVDTVRWTSAAGPSDGLEVPAQVELDPARVALISPRTAGRIERLSVVVGDRVGAGQPVGYLSSPDFVTAETEFLQATRRAARLAGTADAEGTAAIARAARQRLELLGVPASEIGRLEAGATPATLLPIVAPFGGSIIEGMALAGSAVQAGSPLFQLADLSVVNAIAQVPERALPVVHERQEASVSVAAFPTLHFAGRVTRLLSGLDSITRTVKAVVRVPNATRQLRPGMFATVRLRVQAGAAAFSSGSPGGAATLITIPESAVIVRGQDRYVFVLVGPRTFERRPVTAGSLAPPGSAAESGGRVIIQSGLAAGDLVVVTGAFTLQSELGKSQLGGDER